MAVDITSRHFSYELASLSDVIPSNASPEEALNIYLQSLLAERDHLTDQIESNTIVGEVVNVARDFFVPRKEVERLTGDNGVIQQIKSIAPIVLLNKLPEQLADDESRSFKKTWIGKVSENIGQAFKITGKEAAKIILPYSASTDNVITDKDLAENITTIVDKMNITDAQSLVTKDIVEDRTTYDRWTAG